MTMFAKHFALIGNAIEIDRSISVEVIPNHIFRSANAAESMLVRNWLIRNEAPESVFQFEQGSVGSIDHTQWRYHVIEFIPATDTSFPRYNEVERLSRIAMQPLMVRLSIERGGSSFRPVWGNNFSVTTRSMHRSNAASVEKNAIEDVRTVYNSVEKLGSEFKHIDQAISNHHVLMNISPMLPLYALGLFAVIESLITHNPHSGSDSLTHQVANKMNLLGKLMNPALSYDEFTPAPNVIKTWKKLYSYRSHVAHGSSADFATDLASLKNDMIVTRFLEKVAIQLLRLALREPALVTDLKAC